MKPLRQVLHLLNQDDYDDELYRIVAQELLARKLDKGLWLKALVETDADEARARVAYTKLRLYQLKELQRKEAERVRVETERKEKEAQAASIQKSEKALERVLATHEFVDNICQRCGSVRERILDSHEVCSDELRTRIEKNRQWTRFLLAFGIAFVVGAMFWAAVLVEPQPVSPSKSANAHREKSVEEYRKPYEGHIDRSAGGFTLVADSLPQSAAEAEAQRYRQLFSSQSIPADVIQGESGGRIRYRVAIGQVPTKEEATALLSRLASDLPEGAWVTRIPPAE